MVFGWIIWYKRKGDTTKTRTPINTICLNSYIYIIYNNLIVNKYFPLYFLSQFYFPRKWKKKKGKRKKIVFVYPRSILLCLAPLYPHMIQNEQTNFRNSNIKQPHLQQPLENRDFEKYVQMMMINPLPFMKLQEADVRKGRIWVCWRWWWWWWRGLWRWWRWTRRPRGRWRWRRPAHRRGTWWGWWRGAACRMGWKSWEPSALEAPCGVFCFLLSVSRSTSSDTRSPLPSASTSSCNGSQTQTPFG